MIALFLASFLVLGFDSYLFSRVSGISIPENADSRVVSFLCHGVWMEGMAASGMLATGAAALIVGLGYLLVAHDSRAPYLQGLAILSGLGVLLGAPLLLLFTSFDFYESIFDKPNWVIIYCVSGGAAALTAIAGIMSFRWSHKYNSGDKNNLKLVTSASYAIVVYAILGPAFAAIVMRLPDSVVIDPHPALWILTTFISVVIPACIVVGLAGGIADTDVDPL
ncbi:hypothetical protein NM962_14615 [Mycobacterium sp. SVM_VP21]|nr:hypothetical protein NM962_14615 [Mycobacterium sp. SVM_VP21]